MLQIVPVPDVTPTELRAVFWLVGALPRDEEAKACFEALRDTDAKKLKRAMDLWVQQHDKKPKLHHGWDKSEHGGELVDMHVFKGNEHRLYGVKLHPRSSAPRYWACMVIGHFCKHGSEAPVGQMRRFLGATRTDEFARALREAFAK